MFPLSPVLLGGVMKGNTNQSKTKTRKTILLITVLLTITAVLIGLSLAGPGGGSQAGELKGTWKYSENTSYKFSGNGKGWLILTDLEEKFTFSADDGILSIDFENPRMTDCKYSFSIDGDTLTLKGGEGTSGGEYILIKQ